MRVNSVVSYVFGGFIRDATLNYISLPVANEPPENVNTTLMPLLLEILVHVADNIFDTAVQVREVEGKVTSVGSINEM